MRFRGLAVFLLCATAVAQFRPNTLSRTQASNVVRDYIRMDYEGRRLQAATWERMKPLTTWKNNPDWQGITVISHYQVVSSKQGLNSAVVTVKYDVLGRFELGAGYVPEAVSESVDFRLKDTDDEWKIDELEPMINPHVSKPRALAWLQATLLQAKDPAQKASLQQAVQQLQGK